MLTKCALGIQISEARTHTSIAAAGWVDEEFILVELAAYIEGTDAVADVLKLRRERTVSKIAIDPHSPAATVIKPLTKAGVRVTELTSSQVAVAFGEFVDALKAEQLKVAVAERSGPTRHVTSVGWRDDVATPRYHSGLQSIGCGHVCSLAGGGPAGGLQPARHGLLRPGKVDKGLSD